jgi:hypothetical protein
MAQSAVLILRWGALDEGKNQALDGRRERRGSASEKFYWRPVASTFFRNESFGEYVEGLSHFGDLRYVIQTKVQTDDFQYSPLGGIIRHKPFLDKGLLQCERLDGNIGGLIVVPVRAIHLHGDRSCAILEIGALRAVRTRSDCRSGR